MDVNAAVLTSTGNPAPYADSRPIRVERLTLLPPGPGEVLVRVASAGLCHSDLSVVDGVRPRPVPMVLGHEAAGVVAEVGPGVCDVSVGDHVVFSFVPVCGRCLPCQSGRPALCERGAAANTAGTLLSGRRVFQRASGEPVHQHLGVSGFAEYTVCAQESLVTIPAEVPLSLACLFGCALLTGVGAVFNTAAARPGSSVLVTGLGGVGLAAVMGARAAGCHPVIAVDLDPAKLALARSLGAAHALTAGDDVVTAVRDLTGGGADYAFEAVGHPDALTTAYAATRRGGTTVAIGLPHPDARLPLPVLSLVAEERRLLGCYLGSSVPRRDVPRYIELFRAGVLPVDALAGSVFTLIDINAALDRLAAGTLARQVLLPAGSEPTPASPAP